MADSSGATPKAMIAIGMVAAAAGLYFMLVGAGVLPIPGGPGNLHGPLWILLCAGLAFFLAGSAVVLHGIGRANDQGEFPADAPSWLRVVQYLIGVAVFACFGAIGSWIAFGPGERAFSGSLPFFSGEVNAAIGRTAFGIGAVIVWLCTLAFAVSGARRFLGRGKSGLR
jgi:hypothetical protein